MQVFAINTCKYLLKFFDIYWRFNSTEFIIVSVLIEKHEVIDLFDNFCSFLNLLTLFYIYTLIWELEKISVWKLNLSYSSHSKHTEFNNFTGCLSNISINGRYISKENMKFWGNIGKIYILLILSELYLIS